MEGGTVAAVYEGGSRVSECGRFLAKDNCKEEREELKRKASFT